MSISKLIIIGKEIKWHSKSYFNQEQVIRLTAYSLDLDISEVKQAYSMLGL